MRELEPGYVVLGDAPEPGPVWKLGTEELNSDKYKPDEAELGKLKALYQNGDRSLFAHAE